MERTLDRKEIGYQKLQIVANELEQQSPNGLKYVVGDCYLDYGQSWMWTTIISRGEWEYQVLNPKQWKDIMLADSFSELYKIVDEIRNGKFFLDK